MDEDRRRLKEMADLLREGATMLSQSCPTCNVPLFRLRSGEIICPVCRRRAVIVGRGEVEGGVVAVGARLKSVLYRKLAEIIGRIEEVEDEDELMKLVELARRINELLKEI